MNERVVREVEHFAKTLCLILGAVVAPLAIFAWGCSSSEANVASATPGSDASANGDGGASDGGVDGDGANTDDGSIVGERPYKFKVPIGYDQNKATPLVILLHAYAKDGAFQENYFQFGAVADEQTFLYAYPDGTLDPTNERFWASDDACRDPGSMAVDDVAYVNAIIDDVSTKYSVDPKRIFVVGHSNGAFMSHRLACDASDRIAAIASLAGAVGNDPSKCNPSNQVSVLDVHGDADMDINYNGSATLAGKACPYPSEAQTMATWAAKNGCTGALAPNGLTLDLDTALPGAETSESAYAGCPTGIDVELWTIHGASHVPQLAHPVWAESIYAFFKAHPKP